MDPTQALIDALESLHVMRLTPSDETARTDAVESLDALADWLRKEGFAPNVEDALASVDLPALDEGDEEPEYVTLTRRTNEPKLSWLERELDKAGIPHKRDGESFHAPIMKVPAESLERAQREILDPVDDLDDDDARFQDPARSFPESHNTLDDLLDNR